MSELQISILNETIQKLKNREFSIYVYSPGQVFQSGGINLLYRMCRILKDNGFNVKVLYEAKIDERASAQATLKAQKKVNIFQKMNFDWMDVNVSDLEFIPQAGEATEIIYSDGTKEKIKPLSIGVEDFLIIPEGFGNIIAQTVNLTCKRIVLAQSWLYILNSLNPSQTWSNLGIKDVISISDVVTNYIKSIFPAVNIKQFDQSINRNLFNVPTKISHKQPIVLFNANRGPESRAVAYSVIRTFQEWFPHYKWVKFIEMSGLSKEEYANRMKEGSIFMSFDSVGAFSTSSLEAIASGTLNISYLAYGPSQYANQNNGYWIQNGDAFQMAETLGAVVDRLFNGVYDNNPEIQKAYEETLSRYTEEKEQEAILKIYNEYINERINELTNFQTK